MLPLSTVVLLLSASSSPSSSSPSSLPDHLLEGREHGLQIIPPPRSLRANYSLVFVDGCRGNLRVKSLQNKDMQPGKEGPDIN